MGRRTENPCRAPEPGKQVEQIYFCIRMAAAEILTEEPVPVILDDVFAFYDDKRLESVLKLVEWTGKAGYNI